MVYSLSFNASGILSPTRIFKNGISFANSSNKCCSEKALAIGFDRAIFIPIIQRLDQHFSISWNATASAPNTCSQVNIYACISMKLYIDVILLKAYLVKCIYIYISQDTLDYLLNFLFHYLHIKLTTGFSPSLKVVLAIYCLLTKAFRLKMRSVSFCTWGIIILQQAINLAMDQSITVYINDQQLLIINILE